MNTDTPPVLLWLRRELRLHDNAALIAACATGRPVLPVFVLDDETPGAWRPGGASRWWLHHSLTALAADLAARGAPLILRRGRLDAVLAALVRETRAVELHAGQPLEPWARLAVDGLAGALGVPLHLHRTATLFDPGSVRTRTGGTFSVFTPFARACRAHGTGGGASEPQPAPRRIPAPARLPRSDDLAAWRLLPTTPDWAGGLRDTWGEHGAGAAPGERGAHERLAWFCRHVLAGYDTSRNSPGTDGVSMLSPRLHWGELSPAQAWHAAEAAAPGTEGTRVWTDELLWREFSANLLWEHPTLPEAPLRGAFAAMRWRTDPAGLRAWRRGRTGLPIVDAGMRQLWHSGWMHNRVRMITASFLVKHLLLPWQDGEAWFWDTLVDADLASNAAQWQWVAGCGSDAAPYFRVFNPVLQGQKFDPRGDYVRRFVPELAQLPDRFLHAPWTAGELERAAAGVRLGATYPWPIVDLAEGRARALHAFQMLPGGRPAAGGPASGGPASGGPAASGRAA